MGLGQKKVSGERAAMEGSAHAKAWQRTRPESIGEPEYIFTQPESGVSIGLGCVACEERDWGIKEGDL